MGLHWEPLMTPQSGHETEFENLFQKLVTDRGPRREQLTNWLETIGEPPYTTLGAPRVGYDAAANEWLRARLEKSGRLAELDKVRVEMHGYNVLELMPPSDGFPVYSSHTSSEHLDRYAFHVQLLLDADVLDPAMRARAQQLMLPSEHVIFAAELLGLAKKFVIDNALVETVSTVREPVFPEGSKERAGHILFAAAKWCSYWSGRGYGLALTSETPEA